MNNTSDLDANWLQDNTDISHHLQENEKSRDDSKSDADWFRVGAVVFDIFSTRLIHRRTGRQVDNAVINANGYFCLQKVDFGPKKKIK